MPLYNKSIRKNIAFLGMFLALALILSYVESLIPLTIGIPGIKLGLANLAVVLCLYLYNSKYALLLSVLRVVIAGFLFGSLYSILYSLAGAICSLVFMLLAKRVFHFGITGCSIIGGVMHNMAQLVVAVFIVENARTFFLLPYLLIAGTITGALIGLAAGALFPYLNKILKDAK